MACSKPKIGSNHRCTSTPAGPWPRESPGLPPPSSSKIASPRPPVLFFSRRNSSRSSASSAASSRCRKTRSEANQSNIPPARYQPTPIRPMNAPPAIAETPPRRSQPGAAARTGWLGDCAYAMFQSRITSRESLKARSTGEPPGRTGRMQPCPTADFRWHNAGWRLRRVCFDRGPDST